MDEYQKPKENECDKVDILIGDDQLGSWKEKAREYIDDPVKTQGLLRRVVRKTEAGKNNHAINSLLDKVQLLFSLVKDWSNGEYKNISKSAIIAVIGGLLYFVSPIDLVPDFLIGLGLVDDAAVLGLVINQLDKELGRYKSWKNNGLI